MLLLTIFLEGGFHSLPVSKKEGTGHGRSTRILQICYHRHFASKFFLRMKILTTSRLETFCHLTDTYRFLNQTMRRLSTFAAYYVLNAVFVGVS